MTRLTLVCLAVVVAAGCAKTPTPATAVPIATEDVGPTEPVGTPPTEPTPAEPTIDLANSKPDFTFKAEDFYAEVKNDPNAAKAKYLGKVIEITGTVFFMFDIEGPATVSAVILQVPGDLHAVWCYCPAGAWKIAVPKSTITARGVCSENVMGSQSKISIGVLKPCIIVKSSVDLKTFQLSDVLKEIESDVKAADDKYREVWCYLEGGKVKSFGKDKYGQDNMYLEGPEGVEVSVLASNINRTKLEKLTPGTPVKLFGNLNVYTFDGTVLGMDQARLVE